MCIRDSQTGCEEEGELHFELKDELGSCLLSGEKKLPVTKAEVQYGSFFLELPEGMTQWLSLIHIYKLPAGSGKDTLRNFCGYRLWSGQFQRKTGRPRRLVPTKAGDR